LLSSPFQVNLSNREPMRLAMMNTRLRWCGAPTSDALNMPHVVL
jgi:hypothetical protein